MTTIKTKIETCSVSRTDELKAVATKFTSFLVSNGFISLSPVSREHINELYLLFQKSNPSRVHAREIIHALNLIHVLKKHSSNVADNNSTVQFKNIIFSKKTNGLQIDTAELLKPRIMIYKHHSYVFRSKVQLEPDIEKLDCLLCNLTLGNEDAVKTHELSELHKMKSIYRNDRIKLKESVPFLKITGINTCIDINETQTFTILLENVDEKSTVEIEKAFFLMDKPEIVPSYTLPISLKKNEKFECKLKVNFSDYKSHSYPSVFIVGHEKNVFKVLVESEFKVIEKNLHDLDSSTAHKNLKKKPVEFMELNFISGRPLPSSSTKPAYLLTLGQYPIPPSLCRILNHGLKIYSESSADKAMLNDFIKILLSDSKIEISDQQVAVNAENYHKRMHYLLWIEEHQLHRNLYFYNQEDSTLNPVTNCFELSVPGLSEGRPSVLRGDEVYIRRKNATHKFQGIVHDIRENNIVLGLSSSFNYIKGQKVDIEFSFNRVTMRICHRAVDLASDQNLYSILFPKEFNQRRAKNSKLYRILMAYS